MEDNQVVRSYVELVTSVAGFRLMRRGSANPEDKWGRERMQATGNSDVELRTVRVNQYGSPKAISCRESPHCHCG